MKALSNAGTSHGPVLGKLVEGYRLGVADLEHIARMSSVAIESSGMQNGSDWYPRAVSNDYGRRNSHAADKTERKEEVDEGRTRCSLDNWMGFDKTPSNREYWGVLLRGMS